MRKKLVVAVSALAFSQTSLVHAQSSPEINQLINKASTALSHPEKIPETASLIQKFLSDPKNKGLLNPETASEEVKTLAKLQSKLILYKRLEQDLTSSQCNLDTTRKSLRGQDILASALKDSTAECSAVGPGLLSDHKDVTTLITEMRLIDENSYSGAYTITDSGELKFPWQVAREDHEKHLWKFTLVNGGGADANAFNPNSLPNQEQLSDELYRQSLIDTFKTYIHIQTSYRDQGQKPVDLKEAVSKFCKQKVSFFSRLTGKNKPAYCPTGFDKFLVKQAAELDHKESPETFEGGSQKLNAKVAQINKVIEKIQKNSQIQYGSNGKTDEKYVIKAGFKNEAQGLKDYAEYKKLHSEMLSSGPGLFAATNQLNDELGLRPLNPENFIKPLPVISAVQFKKAVKEASEHAFDHGQELISNYESKSSAEDKIKNFLKLNPAAASGVLLKRPDLAKTACRGLQGLSVDDLSDRQMRLMATWGGIVVGGVVAVTGVGAIPMAIVGVAAATPDLAMSYKHFEEAAKIQDGAFAQRNGEKAEKNTETYRTAKSELAMAGAMTATGILLDAHQALKATGWIDEVWDSLKGRPQFAHLKASDVSGKIQEASTELGRPLTADEVIKIIDTHPVDARSASSHAFFEENLKGKKQSITTYIESNNFNRVHMSEKHGLVTDLEGETVLLYSSDGPKKVYLQGKVEKQFGDANLVIRDKAGVVHNVKKTEIMNGEIFTKASVRTPAAIDQAASFKKADNAFQDKLGSRVWYDYIDEKKMDQVKYSESLGFSLSKKIPKIEGQEVVVSFSKDGKNYKLQGIAQKASGKVLEIKDEAGQLHRLQREELSQSEIYVTTQEQLK